VKSKSVYLILCILGVALPYWQFIPWLTTNGVNLSLFVHQLFANRIGAFFGLDVFVSAIVLMVFVRRESGQLPASTRWWVLLAILAVGVSLGLPLFLYLQARAIEKSASPLTNH
jgi:hypothetical protein